MDQNRLKEIFHYNPETGEFTRLAATNHLCGRIGEVVTSTAHGYVYLRVDGERYGAHRLAFLYMTGHMPDGEVDHRNRVRNDNRWENLRVVTPRENRQNSLSRKNKSGFQGISQNKRKTLWVANLYVGGKKTYIGCSSDPAEAHRMYVEAKKKLHHSFSH